jgi:hypothetical protein
MPRRWPPVSEIDEAYRAWKLRQQELDELLHPPARKQRPEQLGAPFKLTPDEEKRGFDIACDEKTKNPDLTMDAVEAILKERLKHDDGSAIKVSTETWRSRIIRRAFKNARRK